MAWRVSGDPKEVGPPFTRALIRSRDSRVLGCFGCVTVAWLLRVLSQWDKHPWDSMGAGPVPRWLGHGSIIAERHRELHGRQSSQRRPHLGTDAMFMVRMVQR